jgi:hypothetical protein
MRQAPRQRSKVAEYGKWAAKRQALRRPEVANRQLGRRTAARRAVAAILLPSLLILLYYGAHDVGREHIRWVADGSSPSSCFQYSLWRQLIDPPLAYMAGRQVSPHCMDIAGSGIPCGSARPLDLLATLSHGDNPAFV